MELEGKKILLGVAGSIAAYKAAILVRGLIKDGAQVRVVMTELAKQFITPLTMATVSRNPILVEFFDPENGAWNSHVSLGEWSDLYLIAPATANTMAKMARGVADNLLLTTYLSARCPVAVAPAMDLDMYAHPATQENIEILRSRGVGIIEPGSGELASGLVGKGRMAEPEDIVEQVKAMFEKKNSELKAGRHSEADKSGFSVTPGDCAGALRGKRFVVTAGGTVEAIDPVRYISNHSTGKMGYAIAAELVSRGAEVVLVSAPTSLATPEGVRRVDVRSAGEMYEAFMAHFGDADGAVMCAAVADYTPAEPSDVKIKKSGGEMVIKLKPTQDIAAEAGRIKGDRLLVGFALETNNEMENARAKLARKNLDFIVLNSLRDEGAGFGGDTNKITILDKNGVVSEYPLESKSQAAIYIADKIVSML